MPIIYLAAKVASRTENQDPEAITLQPKAVCLSVARNDLLKSS